MHATASDERQLLLEAVTLLAQAQSDTEATLHERLDQTWRRMSLLEQRYAEFETRLSSIDERLARLTNELLPPPDPGIDQRVHQLRTHIERLSGRSAGASRPPRTASEAVVATAAVGVPLRAQDRPTLPAASADALHAQADTGPTPTAAETPAVEVVKRPTAAPNVLDYLGRTPQDRAGVILIGVGLVAVLYAALANVHF